MPERVQRRRVKGEPGMPPGAVYIGRGSKWGNPVRVVNQHVIVDERGVKRHAEPWTARGLAVRLFRDLLWEGLLQIDPQDVIDELRGRDLACWCRVGQECHGDVLLYVANKDLQ